MTAPRDLLASLPRIVAADLHTILPDLRECAPFESRLALEDVRKGAFRAPSLRVVALEFRPGPQLSGGVFEVEAVMAAYAITESRKGLPREEAAMVIAQAAYQRILEQDWDEPCFGPARQVRAQNLGSAAVQAAGIALWAVDWIQPAALELLRPEEGVPPRELYLGVAPEIGAEHEEDYELIAARPGGTP